MVNETLSQTPFQKQLAFGQIAETEIAKWVMRRGASVLPIYDIEYDTGKGPRLFQASRSLVAPDLLVFNVGKLTWIEAKHKSVFTWYRIGQRWTTGIDLHHYKQYLEVSKETRVPIWLLFLHKIDTPSASDRAFADCPEKCPVGLFGGQLDKIQESHRSNRHGKSGMVYWAHGSLHYLASLDEFR